MLDGVDLEGKKVLLRTDLNLPMRDGEPQKSLRFKRYVETIEELSEKGARTMILSHQGRPGRKDFVSLRAHRELIEEETGLEINFLQAFMGEKLGERLDALDNGGVVLMENVRLLSEELKNFSPEKHGKDLYVREMAKKFDLYINDAFSVAHRSQASVVGFPQHLESFKGPVMKEEIENCSKIREEFDNGVLVLGGEKPSDLVGIIQANIGSVEKILLGGIPGELGLIIKGYGLGKKEKWIRERDLDSAEEEFRDLLEQWPGKIETPVDLATEEGNQKVNEVQGMTWDIGEETADKYAEIISGSDAVLMKGPMGAFEKHAEGTEKILDAISKNNGLTVLGGGHTSSLVKEFGYSLDDFSHVSIAGGAFVKYVSGQNLPGLEAIDN